MELGKDKEGWPLIPKQEDYSKYALFMYYGWLGLNLVIVLILSVAAIS